ncbi:protein nullo [Drosophila bipectinata]|uniref:protein nullo n=1 Tax=Drosophila bipectinata TaxID=42026 RepID=UPI001C892958|nr:protein nullo [Drosophila bipectinata]
MGVTQSVENMKSSEDTTVAAAGPGGMCCLLPRPRLRGLLTKIQRILRHKVSISSRKHKSKTSKLSRSRSKSNLLRTMPRCSSFGSCGTLLTAAKATGLTTMDRHYAQWKCSFEHSVGLEKRPLHDISEAIAGQVTPRGFPSHTDARRCLIPEAEDSIPESPLYEAKVRRRLSLRIPVQPRLPVRRPSARQKAAQARMEAQIQKELCDLEDYYGGFHFAQRNERLVRI